MNNTAKKLKDCFLDMSVHYWLHLAAVAVIALLYIDNMQIEEQKKAQEAASSRAEGQLVWQVKELTGFYIQLYLNEVLPPHGLQPAETSMRNSDRGDEHYYEYYYALTGEEYAALPTEEQMHSWLDSLLFSGPLKAEYFSISVSQNAPKKWTEYCAEPAPLPPDHVWYCVKVKYRIPSTYQHVNHTENSRN